MSILVPAVVAIQDEIVFDMDADPDLRLIIEWMNRYHWAPLRMSLTIMLLIYDTPGEEVDRIVQERLEAAWRRTRPYRMRRP